MSRAYRSDRRWKDFVRIASVCVEEGWDPADYVARGVETLGASAVFMVPSDLLDPNVRASYKKRALAAGEGGVRTEPEEDLEFADETLRSMSGGDQALAERALMSPFTPFPAWYRCVRGSEKVADAWAQAAESEMKGSAALREWLFGRFQERAARIRGASSFTGRKWEDSNG